MGPLPFTFGILGNIVSFLVYLAPLPTFYEIYKRKSTEGFQSLPYLVALFSSMLWFYYAMLKRDVVLLITINSFGCVIEMIYIIMFITYAPKDARNNTIKLFAAMDVASFTLIVFITHFALHGALRVQVLGWICVSISVSVFAAPLNIVAQVIRTKSVQFMPFSLSFFLTLSAITWFSYGLFLKEICIALPNVVGFLLGLLQMLLYAIYRNGGGDVENQQVVVVTDHQEEQALEPVIDTVVVNPILEGCEEFPIPVDANGVDVDDVNANELMPGGVI